MHRFTGDEFDPAPALTGQSPCLQSVRFAEDGTGWAAGERGIVFRSPDGGKTWREAIDRSLLPGLDQVEWRAIETRGNSIWIAGNPGSLILHSHDRGQSWEVSHTGLRGELHGLSFVDEQPDGRSVHWGGSAGPRTVGELGDGSETPKCGHW
ncbi:MAG: YCF48-related protein [Pirellulaceae bacterium]